MDLITLQLNKEECELFKRFREHQDNFQILWDAGVFSLQNGQAVIHMNLQGQVALVELKEFTYRRKQEV